MESAATTQVRIFFLFFIIRFSFLVWVVVFVLGNPETQAVSHSFPKLSAALRRKFGTDAPCRIGRRYVFGLVSREQITTNGTVLGFVPALRRRVPNREAAGLFVDLPHRN